MTRPLPAAAISGQPVTRVDGRLKVTGKALYAADTNPDDIRGTADEALAVVEPPEFLAVGQFYDDFSQVDDAEVAALLRR